MDRFFLLDYSDILLNVFLAIAVDNLADAESLTAIEKEEADAAEAEAEAEADLDKSANSESATKDGDDPSQDELDDEEEDDENGGDGKGGPDAQVNQDEDDPEMADRKRSIKKSAFCQTFSNWMAHDFDFCAPTAVGKATRTGQPWLKLNRITTTKGPKMPVKTVTILIIQVSC